MAKAGKLNPSVQLSSCRRLTNAETIDEPPQRLNLRRTASTLLHENGWDSDVVEKALNHTIGGVRAVYNRAEYAPQRQEMLQYWADYIEQLMTTGHVVLGRFKQVA